MINFKPELVRILKSILENVVETYPDDWASLPVVVYEEDTRLCVLKGLLITRHSKYLNRIKGDNKC